MYHYQTCGLENVWLTNGFEHSETVYGTAVAVADVLGLDREIALTLAVKIAPLSGREVRFLRKHMELSQESLGSLLGIGAQSIALWEKERSPIPRTSEKLLRLIALGHCNGHATIRKAIDQINIDDNARHGARMVFRESGNRWQYVA
ncbi:hypothetical protein KPL74_13535 [Bacillus sp. NP157]|nr:hypothetical protein KPL74_13535 [Bacillus sp. NP157]